jgi:hypothetical protein
MGSQPSPDMMCLPRMFLTAFILRVECFRSSTNHVTMRDKCASLVTCVHSIWVCVTCVQSTWVCVTYLCLNVHTHNAFMHIRKPRQHAYAIYGRLHMCLLMYSVRIQSNMRADESANSTRLYVQLNSNSFIVRLAISMPTAPASARA